MNECSMCGPLLSGTCKHTEAIKPKKMYVVTSSDGKTKIATYNAREKAQHAVDIMGDARRNDYAILEVDAPPGY